MKVTVAICTWNREALLDRTLESFHKLRIPAGLDWEIVVVDNNCTDDTAAIVAKHAARLPVFRVVEVRQGHSHARNRAVDAARGELILWTDDDVQVSVNWVAEFVRVADENPQAGFFGGRVTSWYGDDVPPANRARIEANATRLAAVFSLKDYGTTVRPFAGDEGPFGANMAYRTALMRRFRFDPIFGRVKTELIGADEVSVIRAMQAEAIPGIWVGTTEVEHYIPRERTTLHHFWAYFHALGRTHVRLEGLPVCPTLFGRPRWTVLGYAKARLRAWVGRMRGRTDWLDDYLMAAKYAGFLAECAANREPATAGYLVAPRWPATAPVA